MEYLATFHTHYGAMRFYKHCRANYTEAKMTPVPRALSSSCGVCVRFEAASAPDIGEHEDMECIYAVTGKDTYFALRE